MTTKLATVTPDDERVEVLGLLLGEPVEAEVIDDKQVGGEVLTEGGFEAVVGTGLAEFAEEVIGPPEEDVVAPRRCRTEGLGEEGLADTNWSDEEDVLLALEEVQREELVEVASVELDGCRPVEVVERDTFFEPAWRSLRSSCWASRRWTSSGQDERQEGGIVELLGTREGQPVRQGRIVWPSLSRLRRATRSASRLMPSPPGGLPGDGRRRCLGARSGFPAVSRFLDGAIRGRSPGGGCAASRRTSTRS
ncbi:MAG: hypothetical protein R3B97_00775 [Dehalococcoidia bacterium]